MANEEIIEKGIVLNSSGGYAKVELSGGDNCKECSAKLFCKPSDDERKILEVLDPINSFPGDEVIISVDGRSIFKVSFLLYGIPLIILISVIIFGIELFKDSSSPELFSFLLSFVITGLYYFLFLTVSKNRNNDGLMPKITSIINPSV
jgi:sigma-E factor negative regulatory protein RseC